MNLDATVRSAGGDLESATSGSGSSRFDFMFGGLSKWEPNGSDSPARRKDIDARAAGLFPESGDDSSAAAHNPEIPAGYTYFGQFVTHDLTFDARDHPLDAAAPLALANDRTPAFDLDSVYRGGPDVSPSLYDVDSGRFLTRFWAGAEMDLPRGELDPNRSRPAGRFDMRREALVGDPRNDENLLIAQLHLGLLRLHNHFLDSGRAASFKEARLLTLWHYQWVVRHDFLPRLCGAAAFAALGADPAQPTLGHLSMASEPFVPVEFAVGAMRAGHAMVRSEYRLNEDLPQRFQLFEDDAPHRTLVGGRELPENWTLQWDMFLEWEESSPQRSKRIGPRLVRSLKRLPLAVRQRRYRTLAVRSLERAWLLDVPSGPAVAEALGQTPVSSAGPLWLYVLEEAEIENGGTHLGTVGATIVAETIAWLMAKTSDAWFLASGDWKPERVEAGETFLLADLLALAGMPMTAGQWHARPRS